MKIYGHYSCFPLEALPQKFVKKAFVSSMPFFIFFNAPNPYSYKCLPLYIMQLIGFFFLRNILKA